MPCISGSYNPAAGPLIQVVIIDPTQTPVSSGGTIKGTTLNVFLALADTGASSTCISQKVAQDVGLQPSGKTLMSGATGQSPVDQYTFVVAFMLNPTQDPSGHLSGSLASHIVQGCEFANHGFGFDVLLGRDILCKGVFSLSGDGHYLLCF